MNKVVKKYKNLIKSSVSKEFDDLEDLMNISIAMAELQKEISEFVIGYYYYTDDRNELIKKFFKEEK